MSAHPDESKIRASVEFAEASLLDTIVPAIPNVNVQDAFYSWDGSSSGQGASLLPFIEQRQFLLFDEHIPVYLVLRAPVVGKAILKSYLSRLAINLQAHAVDIGPRPPPKDSSSNPNTAAARSLAQPKDLLYSEDIAQSQDPFIAVRAVSGEEDEEIDTQHVYVIWRKTIYLGRPKIRMQKPAIYFAATASLKHIEQKPSVDGEDEYLESNVASPMNLLAPFNYDPAFAGKGLYLSASRVTKVAPAKPAAHEFSRPLRTSNRKMFQAAPALLLKVHYTRMPPGSKFPVLASLTLEATAFASSVVRIEKIHTQLSNGTCKTFGIDSLHLPVTQSAGDETTWVRQLASTSMTEGVRDAANIHFFEIKVFGEVLLSDDCSAAIEVIWRSNVDLGPLPPAPGTRNSQSIPRGRGSSVSSATSTQALRRSSSADGGGDQSVPSTNDFGITITFSGPEQIHVGEILHWDILLLNRSPQRRSLAIVALPKRKNVEPNNYLGQSEGDSIACAVLDEHTLYSLQARATLEPVGLVNLSPDVRIGPLAPGACFQTSLEFLVLAPGILHLDAVRVYDLATQQFIDTRDLPDTVALE
ncbi:MAG: hypothetical protein Q9165_005150 [Trypethelium subeluteriae]